ncbi:ABC transporter ATP-binding protein [Listeria seeligeri]|uniref:ABC transporter ATP-binding protein n=1 Tax=Listeria seeligeri TaxID=1640 RepID=UPI0016291069|nr:ABC transporter ATP-binding protein [Listeria seeligeri]MBC1422627.1 ABC transporter ATP-binding protein [Listeria seeligeri]MBC1471951.1 ABC transporter ATP-binding protein [Listeria seeligeri]MBC1528632.1 ABC transporter ATP-binding protein [Listeria seeligeri]MBC1538911.1 ABC transporter ATP-binding protein [Listeria seeligeri]MBC1556231.1 ABC transporter ATP-binding protein [Listeria seeligeri]
MTSKVLQLENISKSYKNRKILDNINITVNEGEIVGILGLNGQGKTTMIKILLGLISPDSGTTFLNLKLKEDVGVMLQEVAMPERITVEEWMNLVRVYSKDKRDVGEVLTQLNLQNEKKKICNKLSGGKQRRVQYAVSIINNPTLLILDEPTVGMDIVSKEAFWEDLKASVANRKVTVLLISHDLDEVQDFCTRIAILHNGKIVKDEDKKDLIKAINTDSFYKINTDNLNSSFMKRVKFLSVNESDDYLLFHSENIDKVITIMQENSISISYIEKIERNLSNYFKETIENVE